MLFKEHYNAVFSTSHKCEVKRWKDIAMYNYV